MLPWSLCLPAILFAWKKERRSQQDPSHRLRTLLLLWIGVTVALFSVSQTKQDLYIFPVVAAVAALGGDWVARSVWHQPDHKDLWLTGTLSLVGVVMVFLGGGLLYFFGGDTPVYLIRGAQVSAWVAIAGGVFVATLPWSRRYGAAIATGLVTLIAFNWILVLLVLPSFEQFKPVVPLSRAIEQRAGPTDVIAHSEVALPSMVYYLRRRIEGIYPDQLAERLRSDKRLFVVLPADRYDVNKADYGVETCVVARQKTADIKLKSLLDRKTPAEQRAPPEVLVITNRCPP